MTDKQLKELLCGVHEWMCMPPPQNSFEYTRLHFMIVATGRGREVENDSSSRGDLAKQLALRAPDDYVLKGTEVLPEGIPVSG